MVFCKFCGSSIPDAAGFCPECGKKALTEIHGSLPLTAQEPRPYEPLSREVFFSFWFAGFADVRKRFRANRMAFIAAVILRIVTICVLLVFQLAHMPPEIIARYLPKLIIDPVSLYLLLFWLFYLYKRCELAIMVLVLSVCCIFLMDTIWEVIPGLLYVVFAFVILINTLKLERLEKEYRNTLLEKEYLAYLERDGFAVKKK